MITSVIPCEYCGSTNLRLSRRQTKFELLKMAVGTYPFRCLDCNHRFSVNVWLINKLAYAKCPKCLGPELGGWPQKHYRLPVWKTLLVTFGAHRYRCSACRHRFISFRPREHGQDAAPEPEPVESNQSADSEP